MIQFTDLTKRFGAFTAVDALSFSVPERTAVALWGPNGAGKTTIIKCLLGLLSYSGRIEVAGLDAHRQGRLVRRSLGYVPQELAFYPDLSTLDTALFYSRLKRVPAARAAEVLAQVGLAEHTAKPVRALSGGMKQRLALGLALLADPPLLVLDEPTSSLDTSARHQFLNLLLDVKAAGKTILFTSHRLEEVESLGDEVLVLEAGRLRLTCRAAELSRCLGLRTQVRLFVPPEAMDAALVALQADGLSAHKNGAGLLVDVLPDEKARPIHVLSQAAIRVDDFELE
ncbi:MAG: ABC transporter ATP-binding protein [Caldilineales bacterium]|nr:ABC transporter ATP-binding protein [Caldilineales bacterium]